MPSQLLLCCPGRQLHELNFERLEPLRIRHGEFLCNIGGAHTDKLILMMHAIDEGRKQCRLPAYDRHHLIGAANGTPIAAFKLIENGSSAYEEEISIQCYKPEACCRDSLD